jgi:hypothetical protein
LYIFVLFEQKQGALEMFSPKGSAAIAWDIDFNVYGISLKTGAKGAREIVASTFQKSDNGIEGFSERLKKVYEELHPDKNSPIVAGGHMTGSVCFEIAMPKLADKELKQAIAFEIPRHIPYPPEETSWCYRVVGEDKSGRLRLRIFAVIEREWTHFLSRFDASGIKADAIMCPFMAAEKSDASFLNLNGIDAEFGFVFDDETFVPEKIETVSIKSKDEKFFENIVGIDKLHGSENEAFEPCLMLADYALNRNFKKDCASSMDLPEKLMPQRFKFLKVAAIFLAVFTLLSGGGLVVRNAWGAHARLMAVSQEKARIKKLIVKLKKANTKHKELDELMQKVADAASSQEDALLCLHFLSEKLPAHMWVTSFSSSGAKINMTIKTDRDADNITSYIRNNPFFNTEDVRKRRNSDGSKYIYMRMTYRQTGKNNG